MQRFPVDKMLKGVTPEQYCRTNGLDIQSYNRKLILSIDKDSEVALEKFIHAIPAGTEVVVNYHYEETNFRHLTGVRINDTYIDGIALIPKNYQKEKK